MDVIGKLPLTDYTRNKQKTEDKNERKKGNWIKQSLIKRVNKYIMKITRR